MKTVSIIVPIYNTAHYLPRCLDSLLNQTINNAEIILVNDASTDNSLQVIKDYLSRFPEQIILIDLPQNGKQGAARNRGIEIASGQYIGFVDSDDWVDLDMFSQLYRKAINENLDIVDCDYTMVDEYDVKQVKRSIKNCPNGILSTEDKKKLILDPGYFCTKIYRTDLIKINSLKFPEGIFYEDLAWTLLALPYAQSIGKIKLPLYNYFVRKGSTTKTQNVSRHFDRLLASQFFLKEYQMRSLYQTYQQEIDFQFIYLYYIRTIVTILHKFDVIETNKLREIRQYIRTHFTNYRANMYFHKIPITNRIFAKMNDISPKLLIFFYKNIYQYLRKNSINKNQMG